jgi:hypothetical protein
LASADARIVEKDCKPDPAAVIITVMAKKDYMPLREDELLAWFNNMIMKSLGYYRVVPTGREDGVDIESQRAAETAWTYLAFDSVSPYIDTRPPGRQPSRTTPLPNVLPRRRRPGRRVFRYAHGDRRAVTTKRHALKGLLGSGPREIRDIISCALARGEIRLTYCPVT